MPDYNDDSVTVIVIRDIHLIPDHPDYVQIFEIHAIHVAHTLVASEVYVMFEPLTLELIQELDNEFDLGGTDANSEEDSSDEEMEDPGEEEEETEEEARNDYSFELHQFDLFQRACLMEEYDQEDPRNSEEMWLFEWYNYVEEYVYDNPSSSELHDGDDHVSGEQNPQA